MGMRIYNAKSEPFIIILSESQNPVGWMRCHPLQAPAPSKIKGEVISLSLDASKDEDSTTSGHLFLFLTTIVVKLFFLNEVGRWKFLQFEFVSSFTV